MTKLGFFSELHQMIRTFKSVDLKLQCGIFFTDLGDESIVANSLLILVSIIAVVPLVSICVIAYS